jgi:L-ascorbate metabolism protein UlaG (beta-lactamase superfamily)
MIVVGVLGGLSLAFLATGLALGCAFTGPSWHGPESDHFKGGKFVNELPRELHGLSSMLKWQAERKRGPWSEELHGEPGPKPPERVASGVRVTWVGHATLLVQVDGLNVLTDPIWSERASPVSFAGPKRVRPPGVRFEDLPPIDVVLVSHNHYDHLDVATLVRLRDAFNPRFFVGLGNGELLSDHGIDRVTEVDWWHAVQVAPGLTITSVPEQHFSGRWLTDRNETLWTGYVVSSPSGRVYFAGDTGYGPQFTQARERLGPMRVALLPIGAYEPRWFMGGIHMSPAEAVQAATDLQATTAIPMHFGTFRLADDGEDQPPRDLAAALGAQSAFPPAHFPVLSIGEGRDLP